MNPSEQTVEAEKDESKEGDSDLIDDLWDVAILTKTAAPNPPKSSDEILTELFGAFNAKPPKSTGGSSSENEGGSKAKKKKKKKHKERKHKKKRSRKHSSGSDGESSDSEKASGRKEKKRKKHKKSRRKDSSDHHGDVKTVESNGHDSSCLIKESDVKAVGSDTVSSVNKSSSSEVPCEALPTASKGSELSLDTNSCEVSLSDIPRPEDATVPINTNKSEDDKESSKTSDQPGKITGIVIRISSFV